MGKAIYVSGVDWSESDYGQVTVVDNLPVTGMSIVGPNALYNRGQYKVTLTPVFTSNRGVTWSITSGSSYATIDQTGKVTALFGADDSEVTIRATSTADNTVYAEKTLIVNYGTVEYFDYLQSDGASYLLVDGTVLYGGKITARHTFGGSSSYVYHSKAGTSLSTVVAVYVRSGGDVGLGMRGYNSTGVRPEAGKIYVTEIKLQTEGGTDDTYGYIFDDNRNLIYTSDAKNAHLGTDISVFVSGTSSGASGTEFTPNMNNASACRLYSLIVTDSEENVIRNLKPATLDGEPGLFDMVQNKMYLNLGTGTLTVGND